MTSRQTPSGCQLESGTLHLQWVGRCMKELFGLLPRAIWSTYRHRATGFHSANLLSLEVLPSTRHKGQWGGIMRTECFRQVTPGYGAGKTLFQLGSYSRFRNIVK